MKKNNNKRWVRKRHYVFSKLFKIIFLIFFKFRYNLKRCKFKIKKNEQYIVLSNHVTTLDPFMLYVSFNKQLYFVGSDDLMHIKYASFWIKYITGMISKSKGQGDIYTIKSMMKVLNEGGSIALFPEGNRTYSGRLCNISITISKFIKKSQVPVVLYNIIGGYGCDPRWGIKKRRGNIETKIKRVLSVEEINELTVEKLQETINKELEVKEVPTNYSYKCKTKAERLERILFYCPECHSINTLHSNKNNLTCSKCNLDLIYNEKLEFVSSKDLTPYKFRYVYEWYDQQMNWIKNYDLNNSNVIFTDELVELITNINNIKTPILTKSQVRLTKDILTIENKEKKIEFNLRDIYGVAVLGKAKMIFRHDLNSYIIQSNKKDRNDLNSAKYVFMINHIKNEEGDFFGI